MSPQLKYYHRNKAKIRAYHQALRADPARLEKRRADARERARRYYHENPEIRAKQKARAQTEEFRAYRRNRWAKDKGFAVRENLGRRISQALRGVTKSARTMSLLGCTINHLRAHLEGQFKPGMTWANYGAWHVDHRKPCADFDLKDAAQQRACFHFTNLQPLWAFENWRKGARAA